MSPSRPSAPVDAPVPTRGARCTGPGEDGGPCPRPQKAKGLCAGHLSQLERRQELHPLRPRGRELVVMSLRVPEPVKLAAHDDPDGARLALQRWLEGQQRGRRQPKK